MIWRRRLVLGAVLVGVGVLVVSLGGAAFLLPATAQSPGEAVPPASLGTPPSVVCNGTVDIEGGLLSLVPSLSTPVLSVRVAEVYAREGQTVDANDKLLELHHELVDQTVEEAKAAVKEAEVKLKEANLGLKIHAELVKAQEAVIAAKDAEVKAANTGIERLQRAISSGVAGELQLRESREKVEALRLGVDAERRKLDQLQAAKPVTKPEEANAVIERLKIKVTQAEKAQAEYTMRAPVKGEIIRALVEPGTVFTSQTRHPAYWFRPSAARLIVRAELDQEFASRVKAGMDASIEDETDPSGRWKAKVDRLGSAYLPRRAGPFGESLLAEPSRTLEVFLSLTTSENLPRIGQKVRVTVQ